MSTFILRYITITLHYYIYTKNLEPFLFFQKAFSFGQVLASYMLDMRVNTIYPNP